MKPRIFISSTYYDLKYVRESLEKFLSNMNFEPVLFEANKVTFEHGKPLDISCFNEVKSCHIMILMIGGRYGAIISDQNAEAEKTIYDKEYTSITRKEYETALQNNIPTFIFIDKNVHSEYNTYKMNREFYEKAIRDSGFKFFSVDSINVFKFIDLVSNKALKSFEKIEEIELYLREQISGMFHLYLESLKQNSKQDEIFDAVKELKSLTSSMNTIVKEVGKKIIDPEKYKEVIDEQFNILLSFFFENFFYYVGSEPNTLSSADEKIIDDLVYYFKIEILSKETLNKFSYQFGTLHKKYSDFIISKDQEIFRINIQLNEILPGFHVTDKIADLVVNFFTKIKPVMNSAEQETLFTKALREAILESELPF